MNKIIKPTDDVSKSETLQSQENGATESEALPASEKGVDNAQKAVNAALIKVAEEESLKKLLEKVAEATTNVMEYIEIAAKVIDSSPKNETDEETSIVEKYWKLDKESRNIVTGFSEGTYWEQDYSDSWIGKIAEERTAESLKEYMEKIGIFKSAIIDYAKEEDVDLKISDEMIDSILKKMSEYYAFTYEKVCNFKVIEHIGKSSYERLLLGEAFCKSPEKAIKMLLKGESLGSIELHSSEWRRIKSEKDNDAVYKFGGHLLDKNYSEKKWDTRAYIVMKYSETGESLS